MRLEYFISGILRRLFFFLGRGRIPRAAPSNSLHVSLVSALQGQSNRRPSLLDRVSLSALFFRCLPKFWSPSTGPIKSHWLRLSIVKEKNGPRGLTNM